MSVDSTALERSALERKDRDELVTIAQALGGKPAARAAKATIINLILELTGVGEAPAAAPVKAARSRKAAAPQEAAPVEEPEAAAEPEPEADEPAAEEVDAPDDEAPVGSDAADDTEPDEPTEDPRARREGQQQRGQGQGGQPQGGQGGQQQGGQGAQQGGQGQGADDDEDGGNRRRRRRGRNRDRTGEPQAAGANGGGQGDEWIGDPVDVEGIVDLRDEGYGFLRVAGFLPSRDDAYISVKQARQFGLRRGDLVNGASRPALRNEKNPALLRIDKVNGNEAEQSRSRPRFEDLTAVFPDARLQLELAGPSADPTARIIDLVAPIGKGQRGLIVSPPKAGKTTILKQIVRSIEANHPEVHLFVVLVDERPEEVTDLRRWVENDTSTVVASTFDRPAEEHTQLAELVLERAKRLVEEGHDVVVALDGLTRLARAYGSDAGALYPPKRFFGAARKAEEGGSLTILATALVGTGSRTDELIFEGFTGTENLELRLDRRLADRRVHPAIDVDGSSTRHEELLFEGAELEQVGTLRRALQAAAAAQGGDVSGVELLVERIAATTTNRDLLAEVAKGK